MVSQKNQLHKKKSSQAFRKRIDKTLKIIRVQICSDNDDALIVQ